MRQQGRQAETPCGASPWRAIAAPLPRRSALALVLCAVAALGWTAGPASAQGQPDRITVDWATYDPLSVLIREEGRLEKEFAHDGIAVRWVQSFCMGGKQRPSASE